MRGSLAMGRIYSGNWRLGLGMEGENNESVRYVHRSSKKIVSS
jgi:hypothetical protein